MTKADEIFKIGTIDPKLLAQERKRVLSHLRRVLPSTKILEVGSTAIEGLLGKQDLDERRRVF